MDMNKFVKNVVSLGLVLFLWSHCVFAQAEMERKSGINLNLSYTRNAALNMFYDYDILPEHSFTYSSGAPGLEGRLMYERKVGAKVDMRIGGIFGLQGYKIGVYVDKDFRQTENTFGMSKNFVEMRLPYVGVEAGLRYAIFSFSKNDIGAYAGTRVLYFIPQELSLAAQDRFNGVSTPLFDTKMLVNQDKRLILSPNIGIYYSRKVSERIKIGVQTDVSFSQKTMLVGSEYHLYGDQETLTGRFVKRYQQIDFGLDLVYLF